MGYSRPNKQKMCACDINHIRNLREKFHDSDKDNLILKSLPSKFDCFSINLIKNFQETFICDFFKRRKVVLCEDSCTYSEYKLIYLNKNKKLKGLVINGDFLVL